MIQTVYFNFQQVPARREPEGTGGAGGENVNSNTMPAEGVPAVEVDEAGRFFFESFFFLNLRFTTTLK